MLRVEEASGDIAKIYLDPSEIASVEVQTPEMCEIAVSRDGLLLYFVRDPTIAICRVAIKENGLALEFVPKELVTKELCHLAVDNDWRALRFVPFEEMGPRICEKAVKKNGLALEYVPEELRSIDIVRIALTNCEEAKRFLSAASIAKLPELTRAPVSTTHEEFFALHDHSFSAEWTQEMANKGNLHVIPFWLVDRDICDLAFSKSVDNIRFAHGRFVTEEMAWAAVHSNVENIEFVHEPNEAMMSYAVRLDPKLIGVIKNPTRAIIEAVITAKPALVWKCPNPTAYFSFAFARDKSIIKKAPPEAITQEIAFEIIDADIKNIKYVPSKLLTREICVMAIANPEMLEIITHDFFVPEDYLRCIRAKPSVIRHVPRKRQTAEMCSIALSASPRNIRYINLEIANETDILAAFEREPTIIEHVKFELLTLKMYMTAWRARPELVQNLSPDTRDHIRDLVQNLDGRIAKDLFGIADCPRDTEFNCNICRSDEDGEFLYVHSLECLQPHPICIACFKAYFGLQTSVFRCTFCRTWFTLLKIRVSGGTENGLIE